MPETPEHACAASYTSQRYFIWINLVFFLLLAVFIAGLVHTRQIFSPDSESLYRLENVKLDGADDTLEYRFMQKDSSEEYRFTAFFRREKLPVSSSSGYRLMLYRISADWIIVELNGERIGSLGNLVDKRSNLWNSITFIDIPERLLSGRNELSLIVSASHQLGGIRYPLFITDSYTAAGLEGWFDLVSIQNTMITQGVLGFSFVLFLFLFITSSPGTEKRYEYLLFGAAALFMLINLTDYLPSPLLPLPYRLTKMLTLSALYLAIAFINYGIGIMFSSRLSRKLGHIIISVLLLLLVFFGSSVWRFRRAYSITNVLILVSNISWIVITLRNYRYTTRAKILFSASFILLAFAFIEISFNVLEMVTYLSFTVYGVMFFCIGLSFLLVLDYMEIHIQLESECSRSEQHYHTSITDGLTGVYNKRYIMSQIDMNSLNYPFSIIMIDIDHFKSVNDTCGHEAGDDILRYFASGAQEVIRKNDILGRFGGDEFLIMLPGCNADQAENIAARLQDTARRFSSPDFPEGFRFSLSLGIYTSRSPSESISEAIKKSDKALYLSKERGRDRVTVYRTLRES